MAPAPVFPYLAGLKKALAVSAMVLANANETDRANTLKSIKVKSLEVTSQRLVDQVVPKDPPVPRNVPKTPAGGAVVSARGCCVSLLFSIAFSLCGSACVCL